MPKKKIYDHKFEDIFDSKRAAVVCYLSLEKRNMDLIKRYKKLSIDYDEKGLSQQQLSRR